MVLGVDGWRGGWIGALVGDDLDPRWLLLPDAAAILAVPADLVAVDIPIGLPDAGRRACDAAARRELPGAAGSVFPAPVRPVLGCTSYAEARQVLERLGGGSMSAQAFGLVGKVADVDARLRADPGAAGRVVETHPEVAVRRLTGNASLPSKRQAAGVAARITALTRWCPGVLAALERVPAPVPVDDALDALACAYTATRHLAGRTRSLGDGSHDRYGLPMRIVVPD